MLATLLNRLDRHRMVTQSVVLLAVLAACWFLPRLKVLDSPERWMPQSTLENWDVLQRHFEIGDSVGIGLHFKRPIREDDLPRLSYLRGQLAAIPGVRQVYDCSLVAEKIERVPLTTLINASDQAIEAVDRAKDVRAKLGKEPQSVQLQQALNEATRAIDRAQRFELYSGALWDNPSPDDPTRMLMTVCELEYRPDEQESNLDGLNDRRRRVATSVERIIAAERAKPHWRDVEFHVASGIIMMNEMEQRTRQVAFRFLPLSIVIALLTLLLGFRSWRALAVTVLGSGVAILLMLGWLAAEGGTLGVVTIAAPTLISVIATASVIHFASFAAQRGTTGEHRVRKNLVRWVCVPCLGSAVTTGVGFWMLRFNELAPIRDLGWQMFLGSLLAFLAVFVLSQLVPIRQAHAGSWITPERLQRMSQRSSRYPITTVLLAGLLVAMLGFFAWPRPKDEPYGLHVDSDPFAFFSDDQPIKIALRRFSERKFAVYQLDVVLVPKQPGKPPLDLDEPDAVYLANLAASQQFATRVTRRDDLGVVRAISTLSFRRRYDEFLNELSDTLHTSDGRNWLAAGSQLFLNASSANVLSHTFQSWTVDKEDQNALRFTFVARDEGKGFGGLVRHMHQQLPTDRFDCYLAGSVAQSVDLARGLGKSIIYGLGLSFAAASVLCVLLFRSLRLAVIAVLPNVFPVLVVFGVMGMFKLPISSGSAMVSTVAVGIALNDTIHFLLHYRQRTREKGLSVPQAVSETVRHVGRPIVLTSLVHVAGFAIFLWTDFVPLYQFGLLASIAMLAALVGDLILLPNLLLVFDRSASQSSPHAPREVAVATSATSRGA